MFPCKCLVILIFTRIKTSLFSFLFFFRMGRFFSLVDTPKHRQEFKKHYRIPNDVTIEQCHLGKWHEKRPSWVVAILMNVFIERGMRIPMGKVTKDFLCIFKLCRTQCTPNIFRILGSVDAINEKMGVNLTHHDVN